MKNEKWKQRRVNSIFLHYSRLFSIHKTMRTLCVYYYYIVAKSKVEYAKQFISKLLMLL